MRYIKILAILESVLIVTLVPLHLMWYNFIGLLSSVRNIDYSHYISLSIDKLYPIIPEFSYFYLFVWIYPLLYFYYLAYFHWPNFGLFRRIYISMFLLFIISYIFWLIFPNVYTYPISSSVLSTYGFSGNVTLFTYGQTTMWNAFPSLHITITWLTYRFVQMYAPTHSKNSLVTLSAFVAAILTMISVLAIHIHYTLDIVGGLILAELIIFAVTKPLERKKSFAKGTHLYWCSLYLLIFLGSIMLKNTLQYFLI